MSIRVRLGLSSLPLLMVACSMVACSPAPVPEEIGRASEAIINGIASDTQDDSTIAIPLFQNGQFSGACSGVLIAPNLVLTARHCVSQTDENSACDIDGTPLYGGAIYSDRKAADIGVITGTTLKFDLDAMGKEIFVPDTKTLCNQDIALVLLDRPVTTVPFAQLRLDGPPVAGEMIRSVGWGLSNNSNGYGRRRRDNIAILNVGPDIDSSGIGGIGPHEIEVGESICSGDSGGPAYAESTKAVLGVVSRGGNGKMPTQQQPYLACVDGGGYTTYNLYTRVDGFPDLIAKAFAAAGTDPWHEGGPDPRKAKTGDACTGNDACRSSICVSPGSKGYCTQTCDGTPTSCTAPMQCTKDASLQICKLPDSSGCDFGGSNRPMAGWVLVALFLCAIAALRVDRRVP